MARGGLAGIWDRNKKIIKPVATFAAGALGTPALGALVGGAMGGLDRKGKSGIGLDLKGAARGGLEGYGMGSLGSAAGAKVGLGKIGAFEKAGKAVGQKAGALVGRGAASGASAAPVGPLAGSSGSPLIAPYGSGTMAGFQAPRGEALASTGSKLGKVGGWLKDGKNLNTAVTGVQTVAGLADAAQERKVQNRMLALHTREADTEDEQERNKMANMEWLLPYLMRQRAGMGG